MTHIITDRAELREVIDYIKSRGAFAFDTETMGADENGGDVRLDWRRNEVFWISLATYGMSCAIPIAHPIGKQKGTTKEPRVDINGKTRMFTVPTWSDPPTQLGPSVVFGELESLFFSDVLKVGQNLKFDLQAVQKYYDNAILPPEYFCTLVAAQVLDQKTRDYKLGSLVKQEYGFVYDKSLGKEVEKHPFSAAANYARLDAKWTWMLYRKYRNAFESKGLSGIWGMEMDILEVLLGMEREGVHLDVPAAKTLHSELERKLAQLQGEMYRIAGRELNINSPQQLGGLLYGPKKEGNFGLKIVKRTKTGQPSTDKATLETLQHPFLDVYRESATTASMDGFLQGWLGGETRSYPDEHGRVKVEYKPTKIIDGILNADFRQMGARTGRMSCSSPNLQNIPRPDESRELAVKVRGLFVASPGHKLIVADYGQIEYVIMAELSRDPMLVRAFNEGVDLHQYVAAMVFNRPMEDVTKVQRGTAKNTNFACVPFDTQALTKRGWVKYDDLRSTDKVMTYNGKVMHWSPILDKVHYVEAPIVEMSVGKWKVRTTPNHRWDTMRYTGRGHTKRVVRDWATTESLTTSHFITTSAWADTPGKWPISVKEAAIIAWVYTDGSIIQKEYTGATAQAGGRRVGFMARIHQAKFKQEVEELLVGVPHLTSPVRHDGLVTWTLDSLYARDLWSRAGLLQHDQTLEQFVLSLSSDQRKAFIEACFLAEGDVNEKYGRIYTQNEGEVLDAIRVAVLLEGYNPRTYPKKDTHLSRKHSFNVSATKPRVTGQKLKRELVGEEPVWCIRTRDENWVMRQGDVVTLTGNTAYGAGIAKIAAMSDISVEEASRFSVAHHKLLPTLYRWKERELIKCKNTGPIPYVVTLMGRRRQIPYINSRNEELAADSARQAVNAVVQGSAADILKLAMIRLHRTLPPDMHLQLQIHDELVMACPEDRVDDGQTILREAMLGPGIQKLLSVPMKIDMAVVSKWSEAKA